MPEIGQPPQLVISEAATGGSALGWCQIRVHNAPTDTVPTRRSQRDWRFMPCNKLLVAVVYRLCDGFRFVNGDEGRPNVKLAGRGSDLFKVACMACLGAHDRHTGFEPTVAPNMTIDDDCICLSTMLSAAIDRLCLGLRICVVCYVFRGSVRAQTGIRHPNPSDA